VVRLRTTNRPPQVVGLVAEMALRRRIFLPIGRVTSMDAEAVVLSTGTLNLRRFEKRPNELLVLEDLLDRRVTVAPDDADGRDTDGMVVDIGMDLSRNNEWLVTRVAVREHTGRLSRRGHVFQVEYDRVRGLVGPTDTQGTSNLLALLEQMRPADMANALQDLPDARRNEVAAALSDRTLADVLEELPEHDQVEILVRLDRERAADVLERMDPDDAADLLAELPTEDAEKLLRLMEPDEAADLRRLLTYDEESAGGMMTTEPVILGPEASIAEALAVVRRAELSPALASTIYVCRAPHETPTGKYLGMVHIQRLLREPPHGAVGGILDKEIEPLTADAPLGQVTRMLATYNLVGVPVVDADGRLLGAVTVDDVLDHILPDDWREERREVTHG
jgi:CBS domain-containing protein